MQLFTVEIVATLFELIFIQIEYSKQLIKGTLLEFCPSIFVLTHCSNYCLRKM